jgi:hypothetical protein
VILVALARRQQMDGALTPQEFPMRISLDVISGKNYREVSVGVAMPRQRHPCRVEPFGKRKSRDVAAADGASSRVRYRTGTTWRHAIFYVAGVAFVYRN